MREDIVQHLAGLNAAGPTDHAGHAEAAFPGGGFFAAKWRGSTIGPGHHFSAVVGAVDHDGVLRNAKIIKLLQQLADMAIMFHHTIRINAKPGLALAFCLQPRPDMHARGIEPGEEGLIGTVLAINKIQ